MSCPDPYRPNDPLADAVTPGEPRIENLVPSDIEVLGLTSALAARGGGASSNDLALDLVLNQIVEQACLATGATGAAIALLRDGEMVCRATTGRNAPDLGVRLDNAGFSAECLRIGTLQRCDDTETDPRVDSTACRLLGVRSILVVPLWYWGEFMGIFEIFSPRPNAFGERDEQTLQALAYRIVRQAKQATGSITGFPESSTQIPPPPPPRQVATSVPVPTPIRMTESEPVRPARSIPVFELTPAKAPREMPDLWTMVLASSAILIACAIVGLMIWRVGWAEGDTKKALATPETVHASPRTAPDAAPHEEILELNAPGEPTRSKSRSVSSSANDVVISASKKSETITPPAAGGLAIYEKGKLIYGTPISDPNPLEAAPPKPVATAPKPHFVAKATPASAVESTAKGRVPQLTSDAADALLTHRVEPDYPDVARRAHVQGTVMVSALVSADGKVLEANAISGSAQLVDAATAAVMQWRYKPYVVKGSKVSFQTQVPVTFMLPQ
jgi:TonB family protein